MERYESYKDSGVAWIGQVPSHWIHSRIKFCLSRSVAGIWGDDEKGNKDDIVCFRVADFDYSKGCLTFDKLTIRNVSAAQLLNRLLHDGDLLIEKSGGGDVTPVGRVVRFNYNDKAICSNFIHSISVKEGYSSNYLYYYFYGMYANKVNLLYFNQTTGIQNLKVGEYLSQKIYLPTLVEQQAIATYLDKRCSEIDKAIATQQKRIALLQELKQSIITQAVTRGTHPDVPLKNSGVEWIGKVPEHWEVRRLKSICQSKKYAIKTGPFGTQLKGQDLYPEGDIRVYNQRNVIDDNFNECGFYVTHKKASDLKSFYTQPNDLLITSRGTIGKCSILPDNVPMGILHPCLIAVRIDQKICTIEWAKLFIGESNCFAANIFLNSNATTIDVIYTDTLKNVIITIPPVFEQKKIIAYIDQHIKKLDSIIKKANKRIEYLQELRQSVITEAITGKIKVC